MSNVDVLDRWLLGEITDEQLYEGINETEELDDMFEKMSFYCGITTVKKGK